MIATGWKKWMDRASGTTCGLCVAAVLLVTGCQAVQGPEGTDTSRMRRPTWWGFYRRGVARSRRGEWAGAAADFRVALGVEPGAIYPDATDRRRAKTYGLHFLDDYFPHRELGVCHFYLGEWDRAEQELKASEAMTPSARARAYLNKVREQRLRSQPAAVGLPAILLNAPADGTVLREPVVRLRGTVSASALVSRITVGDEPVYRELATPTVRIDRRVELVPGEQELVVKAEDLVGNRTTWRRRVRLDMQAPMVAVVASDGGAGVWLAVSDDQALSEVRVDGRPVAMTAGVLSHHVLAPLTGDVLEVVATDAAGNRTVLRRTREVLQELGRQWRRHRRVWQVAAAGDGLKLPARQPDRSAPRLTLIPEVPEELTVTTDSYMVDMLVQDPGELRRLAVSLNGRPVAGLQPPARATMSRWACRLALTPGPNRVDIVVEDAAGNVCERAMVLRRRLDCLWREELRMTAALTTPDTASVAGFRAVDVKGALQERLLARPRRLRMVERDPLVLERILREHGLSRSPLAAGDKRLPQGRMLPAEWLLQTYVTPWGGRDDWDLVMRAVDVETGEIVLTLDVHGQGFDPEEIAYRLRGVGEKLRQQLPAMSARVVAVRGRDLEIGLGRRAQIAPGLRFFFVPQRDQGPGFDEPVRQGGQLLEGRVRRVWADHCTVRLDRAPEAIAQSDHAVLR